MKILVLGASGMLGSTTFRVLSEDTGWEVSGTVRSDQSKQFFSKELAQRLLSGVDVENHDTLVRLMAKVRPDAVVNCIGLIKHKAAADDPLQAVSINSLLPHRLATLCEMSAARLVQISTDCVFSGDGGNYQESDPSDARDFYGKSKFLGEVHDKHAITLRTSIIGHELQSKYGLLNWFLSQQGRCVGFKRAIFSGLPTVMFAQILRDIVIPRAGLSGLYHVASRPIAKFDLLKLIAQVYGKSIEIEPDEQFVIDRSLNSSHFNRVTGYVAPEWPELIETMRAYH